jgi:chromosome segregation ATPase
MQKASALNVAGSTFLRLKEIHLINNLRKQNNQLKKNLTEKEEEIETYKNNLRCAKYSKLEFSYSNNLNQLILIKKDNENLKNNIEELSSKYSEILDENQKIINSLTKYRSNFDEIKIKSKNLEENNHQLISRNKYLEEKVNMLSKSLNNQPVQMQKLNLRQKENLINSLKNEINEEKEKSKLERQRLEKRISFMLQDYNKIKEALE